MAVGNESSLEEQELVLENNRSFIIKYLEPDDVIDELIQARIIGPNAAQRIVELPGSRTDKNRTIFEQMSTAGPGTLDLFCNILRRKKRQSFIAEQLDKCKQSLRSLHFQSTTNISKYRHQLKYKYKSLCLSSPEELLECRSSEYVNLFLTKFDNKSKTNKEQILFGYLSNVVKKHSEFSEDTEISKLEDESLTLADVLNVKEEERKVILIEGGPGMGKSTLAIQICKSWADGELLEEYDAVILLPLRDPEIQAANNIKDLLLILDDQFREHVYQEIISTDGVAICFLLEGYDELPHGLRHFSIFTQLLQKLPKCTLIYTSRPGVCDKLQYVITRRIKIHGFKDKQVVEYISNAFENVTDGKKKALQLTSKLKNNPLIRGILYVPIHIAIICHLFTLTSRLPNTLTELYTLLCLNLILRHINKYSAIDTEYLDSLDNLPAEISEEFAELCLVAYRGIEDDRIVFCSHEIKGYGVDPSNLRGLGLLLIAPSTSVYGREKSYNFLHLTVQEFCAACYISRLQDKEQFECFKKYQFYDSFRVLWRFYSGITKLKNKDIFYHMLPSKLTKSNYRKKRTIELLHCVYEAHNDEVCHVVGNHLDGNVDLSLHKLDQVSCSALGYLFEQYRGALKLINLFGCNCDVSDNACTILLSSLLQHHDTSNIEFILNYNKLTKKSCLFIASLLSSNYRITKLNIGSNDLANTANVLFKSLQYNSVLMELFLQKSSLRSSDMQSLGQMLTSNNTLSVMDISYNDIGPDGCQYLADYRNISLNKLIMRGCKLGISGADKIGIMLCHNRSISFVDISENRIGDNGVEKLVEHLKSNRSIKHIDLWENNISSNGASHLRKLFSLNHTTVNSIQLGMNPLKDEGVDLILQSITINMEYVGLISTQITSFCSSMLMALHKIKSVSCTFPDNCNDVSDILANTTGLEELELCDGSNLAYCTMINGINRSNSIKNLTFNGGYLDHQTVLALAGVMKFNKTITKFVIFHVDVSPCNYSLLADALTVNCSIKEVKIWPSIEKRLDQPLVLHFLKQLNYNYTVEMLTLLVTTNVRDDHHFIRDVEMWLVQLNALRQKHGKNPLHVTL